DPMVKLRTAVSEPPLMTMLPLVMLSLRLRERLPPVATSSVWLVSLMVIDPAEAVLVNLSVDADVESIVTALFRATVPAKVSVPPGALTAPKGDPEGMAAARLP